MVMELLVGEPLDKRLERLGRLTLQETARIVIQVCRALQRAHTGGIIHRDLKPENIFLVHVPDDDDEIAKVLDFGIAKIKPGPGEKGLTSSTKTGAVLGTPYYMAPEQARGLRTIDHRADLWSLGVIAYKCVTGVLPFDGESVGDLLVKICTAAPPTPSLTTPGLPPAFDAWFARTLEREPERRYQSATELAEALALAAGVTVRRGGPVSSHADAPAPSLPSSRPQPPTGAETPLPAAALTSAPFVTSASPGSKRGSRGVFLGIVAAVILGGSVGVFVVVKLLAPGRHVTQSPSSAAAIVAAPSAAPSVTPGAASVTLPPIASTVGSAAAPAPAPSAQPPAPSKPHGGGGPRPPAPPRPSPSPKPPSSPADPGY
jgi:serine/threonine-protein kinase